MSSNLNELNDHLFAQLDRLSGDLSEEDVDREVKRADAIVKVADQVTDNAKVRLAAAKLFAEHGANVLPHLPLIGKADE